LHLIHVQSKANLVLSVFKEKKIKKILKSWQNYMTGLGLISRAFECSCWDEYALCNVWNINEHVWACFSL